MLLSRDQIDEQTWEDFEDTLITADLGVGPTTELVDNLRTRFRIEGVADPSKAREILRSELLALVDPSMDRTIRADRAETPAVIMVVGVNGTGKTTTVGKLARVLVAEDKDVLLGAADTFRAAAADQLQTWGDRVGVPTVRGAGGGGSGQRRLRGGEERHRGRGRRGAHRHRRSAAHQDRADGRAGQGEAGHRATGAGRRGAAGARRDHRARTVSPRRGSSARSST